VIGQVEHCRPREERQVIRRTRLFQRVERARRDCETGRRAENRALDQGKDLGLARLRPAAENDRDGENRQFLLVDADLRSLRQIVVGELAGRLAFAGTVGHDKEGEGTV